MAEHDEELGDVPSYPSYEAFKAANPESANITDMLGFSGVLSNPQSLLGKVPKAPLGTSEALNEVNVQQAELTNKIASIKGNISGNLGEISSGIGEITNKIKEGVAGAANLPKVPETKLQDEVQGLIKSIGSFNFLSAGASFSTLKDKFPGTNVEKIVYESIANPEFKPSVDIPNVQIIDGEEQEVAQPKKVPETDPEKLEAPPEPPAIVKPLFAPLAKMISSSAVDDLKAISKTSKTKIQDVTRNVEATKFIQKNQFKQIGDTFRKFVENPKPDSKATTLVPRKGTPFAGLPATGSTGFMDSILNEKNSLGNLLSGTMGNIDVQKLSAEADAVEKQLGEPISDEEKARLQAESDAEERRLAAAEEDAEGTVPVVTGTPEEQEAARVRASKIFGFNIPGGIQT